MSVRDDLQTMLKKAYPSARRIVALFLLALVTFLVVNPVWECTDHLDNLRHLGPHGALVVLLAVALAGISLLKSARSLLAGVVVSFAIRLQSIAVLRPGAVNIACSVAPDSGPPLRI